MFNIGFGYRKPEGFAAAYTPPHEYDAQVTAVYLNPLVLCQLGF
jgi:hypothetical protein